MDATRREAPATEEGWYALHDLRRIDWDAWRDAPERERERALSEGVEYLRSHEDVEDAEEGVSAVFAVTGHKADVMVLHLRPTTEHLDRAERAFERTALAGFTERATSYVSVTEVSGYVTEELSGGIENIESDGTRNYMLQRLHPSIPDAEHVCFYPMDKRRGPEHNWYDLPFDERAALISGHGDVGREYAGKVTQIITGSMGFDDYEWGVTLFADDATEFKHLLADMRFDPSSSRYAEFGPFYFGRRFAPEHLPRLFAGESLPAYGEEPSESEESAAASASAEGTEAAGTESEESGDDSGGSGGRPSSGEPPHEEATVEEFAEELRRLGVDADEHGEAGYGLVFYTEEDADTLVEEVDGLRSNFEHYDTHVLTTVRADAGRSAVVSLWKNERAANTASGFLGDLAGVEGEGIGAAVEAGDGAADAADRPDETADHGDEVGATDEDDDIRGELADLDIYAGQPHGEDVYAIVVYSEADLDDLRGEVESLRGGFDRYDTHAGTSLYEGSATDRAAVVSLWDTRDAAGTAGDYLSDLPGVVRRAGEGSHFGTMGMFYTVKPEHREDFVERFDTVGGMLAEMEGHIETDLMVNVEDENDMFIASQWNEREDAMGFFRSDAFRDTVQWGRDVLADRPRHVFLA
ncbi:heme-binding protein [Halosegnis marinus]|uniref:Heme-binding protein n=1 Tax=Halosegnis marinus TaxID=3034023 RepID=A0ABD5ZPC8_9EURY|nr:heme-binding protein [Halosegnis sp. DT85]